MIEHSLAKTIKVRCHRIRVVSFVLDNDPVTVSIRKKTQASITMTTDVIIRPCSNVVVHGGSGGGGGGGSSSSSSSSSSNSSSIVVVVV